MRIARNKRIAGSLLALTAALAGHPACSMEPESGSANEMKADRLLNFLKFVVWTGVAEKQSLAVCFLGAPGVQAAFAANLEQKRVGKRSLEVRAVENADPKGCNVLYIDAAWREANPSSSEPHDWQMLTVSDIAGFTDHGGMIGITIINDHLRFTVNVDNFKTAGLRVSSSLLEVATVRR